MADQTTPRESVRAAFKAVLDAAGLGVTVYDHMPFEGVDPVSVVLRIVSGSNRSPGVGLSKSTSKRGFEQRYRIQVDCYHNDSAEVGKLADKVEQALVDAADALRADHDIHDLRKLIDTDTAPVTPRPLVREARVLMDFEFYTHRELTS